MQVREHSGRNFDDADVHRVGSSGPTMRYSRFFKLTLEPNSLSQILRFFIWIYDTQSKWKSGFLSGEF
jgi:hypothetical protein